MSRELVRYLISSGVVTAILIALVQFGLRWLENRREKKAKEKADQDEDKNADEDRDAAAYDALRAALSSHLSWDYMIINRLTAVERALNEDRVANGLAPVVFAPIPDPPSLRPLPKPHGT